MSFNASLQKHPLTQVSRRIVTDNFAQVSYPFAMRKMNIEKASNEKQGMHDEDERCSLSSTID